MKNTVKTVTHITKTPKQMSKHTHALKTPHLHTPQKVLNIV